MEMNMKTRVFEPASLKEAAQLLKEGHLVAFPTETVFGLGAIANNDQAIKKVYEVKGRPADNPLIVHVSTIDSVEKYVESINKNAKVLMEAFWPGPLTIIFPVKEGVISPVAINYQDRVAIRMPRQLETLLLIEMVGFPLVGPSANLSGKPSPTSVDHVLHDFDGKIAGVVANRQALTDVGVESTVVYPAEDSVVILRPGVIHKELLSQVLDVPIIEKTSQEQLADKTLMSPGVKYTHYSPKQPVYLMQAHNEMKDWQEVIKEFSGRIGILADNTYINNLKDQVFASYSLGAREDWASATQNLFAGLRYLEATNCDLILAQGLEDRNETHAYMNRLTKASNLVL